MVVSHATKEFVCLQRLCSSIGFVQQAIGLYCNNKSRIFLTKILDYHINMKSIDVEYHFERDAGEDKKVLPKKVDTLTNVIDSMMSMSILISYLGVGKKYELLP